LVRQNIVEGLYVYAEAVKQLIVHVKHGIASAGFSGSMQQTLVNLAVTGSAGPVPLPLMSNQLNTQLQWNRSGGNVSGSNSLNVAQPFLLWPGNKASNSLV